MSKVIHSAAELRAELAGKFVGFVPTMGALHEGHATLLRRAVSENSTSVLSVFVNPTQFGPKEDFSKYPRTLDEDVAIAKREGVKFVFAPAAEEIYPPGFSTYLDVTGVSEPWCGVYRPGHFRGVATVVHRLFQIVKPAVAYFGQKDLQQCLVIERMVIDMDLPTRIERVPTVREIDGMALSSRNRYLTADERSKSTVIFRAMQALKHSFKAGERDVARLHAVADEVFATVPDFMVQYRELRSLPDLKEVTRIDGAAAFAVAGFMGGTRLIDNLVLPE